MQVLCAFVKSTQNSLFGACLLTALLVTLLGSQAKACACCADPGERQSGDILLFGPDSYVKSELDRLHISGNGNLFQTACGLECVSGIDNPQDFYQMQLDHLENSWQLNFSHDGQLKGHLLFELPQSAQTFSVDTSPNPNSGSATLYKEIIMSGAVSGTGMFTDLAKNQAQATLILQGTGNSCTQSRDFTHWQIKVDTLPVQFKFYGAFTTPE